MIAKNVFAQQFIPTSGGSPAVHRITFFSSPNDTITLDKYQISSEIILMPVKH